MGLYKGRGCVSGDDNYTKIIRCGLLALLLGFVIGLLFKVVVTPGIPDDYWDHVSYCNHYVGGSVAYSGYDLGYVRAYPERALEQDSLVAGYLLSVNGVCCAARGGLVCTHIDFVRPNLSVFFVSFLY